MNFTLKHTFKERLNESTRVLEKYPDRIPVICEKNQKQKNLPNIDKTKYLVPYDLTIGQFMFVIRKRLNLQPTEALFLFVENIIPPSAAFIKNIYNKYKDADGFLYITYSKENTFG